MIGYLKRATFFLEKINISYISMKLLRDWIAIKKEKKLFRWHFRVPRVPFDPDRSWTHSRDAYAISLSKLERRYC